jgi:hypothetical protein
MSSCGSSRQTHPERGGRRPILWIGQTRLTGQQVPQHGEGRLTSRDNWLKRDHRLGHDSPRFVWGGLRTAQIGDDELGQPREQSDGLGEVLRLRLVEVEDDGYGPPR